VNLIPVRSNCAAHVNLLYDLLAERKPHESISHKVMPTRAEHCLFVASQPYRHWYIVTEYRMRIGAVYITEAREVGIGILLMHRRLGYAELVLTQLMRKHPGRLLANCNPANKSSIALFRKLGFTGPKQITLEHA
jgi:hypothetical protein